MALFFSCARKSRFIGRVLFLTCSFLMAFAFSTLIINDVIPLLSKRIKISYNNISRFQPPIGNEFKRQPPSSSAPNQTQAAKQKHPLLYQPSPQTSVLRALLLFYPTDQEGTFASEFRWFYLSWTEMMATESALWRTDLIVYASINSPLFQELNCVYDQVRQNDQEAPQCRVFPYVRVKDRKSSHQPSSRHQVIDSARSATVHKSLSTYGYIDSINSALEYNNSYAMYDFVLRTDMDCFLTKQFALYIPINNSMLVGHGGYSTAFNNKRLKRIAHDMGWQYAGKGSLGSTWYGPPSLMYIMANYTVEAMHYLVTNEFTTPEREQKVGVLLWPEWHYGVLLLYGGHLAINHLLVSAGADIRLANTLLDQGVTAKDLTDIEKNTRLHLHCWHGADQFSKFAFKAGQYDTINMTTLVNDTSARGYAMRLGLRSKAMTLKQLKATLLDVRKETRAM